MIRILITACAGLLLLGPAHGQTVQTIYVAPSGAQHGAGTAEAPLVLTAGREYDLNRLIRQATDAGRDADVVFAAGTYRDVQLQIIKQGIDTDSLYIQEPGPSSDGRQTMVDGKPYHYHSYAKCNGEGANCRVEPQDYALGATSRAAVTLRAAQPHLAVFDGGGFQTGTIDNNALTVSGAFFGVIQAGRQGVRSERILNVTVTGFVFRNYWNGILIQHAAGVTIDDCVVDNIGTHLAKAHDDNIVGVSGLSADGDSRLVLVKNTTIRNSWNIQGAGKNGEGWPSLMHSVYDGYSHDVIFMNDVFSGSSGPMLKFGYYPIAKDGKIIYEYEGATWSRRGFFINNQVLLAPLVDRGQPVAPFRGMQAFIHDNSQDKIGGVVTQPAKGMVFINNVFRNMLPTDDGLLVTFMRQELPAPGLRTEFPDFFFAGNRIEGVRRDLMIVHRFRGTPVTAASVRHDEEENLAPLLASLSQEKISQANVDQQIARLMEGPLRSPDSAEDQRVAGVLRSGVMPRLRPD